MGLLVLAFALASGLPAGATVPAGSLPPKVKPAAVTGANGTREAPATSTVVISSKQAAAMGFCGGDDWEPEVAAAPDRRHVYVVWAHFPGDPTCDPASGNPNRVYIRVSDDGGKTFGRAHVVAEKVSGLDYPRQVDCVVTVDPKTGAVFVSFLVYGRPDSGTDVAVARSSDFGGHFSAVKVNGPACRNCDHPWTIAFGSDVYSAYAHAQRHFLSHSSDGGVTWHERDVLDAERVAFPEGAVMDSAHNVYFAWGDCTTPGCRGPVAGQYRVSRTIAGGTKTTFHLVASAPAGPPCPYDPDCGFAFFGIQNDIAIDAGGTLYMVWQDGQDHTRAGSPPVVQLSTSTDGGKHWRYAGRADDKTATGCVDSSCYALFPRIEGGVPGQIAVMWMDDRLGLPVNHTNGWNVWLRSSVTGGSSWTGPSRRVSTFAPDRKQSEANGFRFPYGDYEGIDLLRTGSATKAVMIWGEGINYAGGPENPGAVVYRSITL
jgi:hypothetical protein